LCEEIERLQHELEENRVLSEELRRVMELSEEMRKRAKKSADVRAANRELRQNNSRILKQPRSALENAESLKSEFSRLSAQFKSISESQARKIQELRQENERLSAQVV
jgi:hypothetical protein